MKVPWAGFKYLIHSPRFRKLPGDVTSGKSSLHFYSNRISDLLGDL